MIKKLFRFLFKSFLWFVGLSIAWVLLYRFFPVPGTPLMAIRKYQSDRELEIKHEWVDLDDISTSMQLAVVCAEDQNFLKHDGFDYTAIKSAYKHNKAGRNLRGGSTISQQTAKNVFLWPQRSWVRKAMEAWFTFLIENLWSKERILEIYLNSVEMGDGVFGAEAAANHWFNKNAANLNKYEAASIAAILPNPREYRATPRTHYVEGRKKWLLRQMQNFGELKFTETSKVTAKK